MFSASLCESRSERVRRPFFAFAIRPGRVSDVHAGGRACVPSKTHTWAKTHLLPSQPVVGPDRSQGEMGGGQRDTEQGGYERAQRQHGIRDECHKHHLQKQNVTIRPLQIHKSRYIKKGIIFLEQINLNFYAAIIYWLKWLQGNWKIAACECQKFYKIGTSGYLKGLSKLYFIRGSCLKAILTLAEEIFLATKIGLEFCHEKLAENRENRQCTIQFRKFT